MSADGTHQAIYWTATAAARREYQAPVTIKLAPAATHDLVVRSEGKPVPGARVAAGGLGFTTFAVTDADGRAHLRYPAGTELRNVVAWHPTLGVDGFDTWRRGAKNDMGQLSLRPPAPHEVHVVDSEGKAIAGLVLSVNFRTNDSNWIATDVFEGAQVRTDESGTATLPWAPGEGLANLDVKLMDADWKVDKTEFDRASGRETTVHACTRGTIEGRLVMPEGANAEGILISGSGFGPGDRGDSAFVCASRDGTFKLAVASNHGYVLGIIDQQWASQPWSGVPLRTDGQEPAKLVIEVYPATPVNIHITRGPNRQPVARMFVGVSHGERTVEYPVDHQGEKRGLGVGNVSSWMITDADGRVSTGVARGEVKVRLAGNWEETRTLEVDAADPINVEFYRPWLSDRQLTGRLTLDGQAYRASPALSADAWCGSQPADVKVQADGTFQASFDGKELSLLVIDRENHRSGFVTVGQDKSTVDIAMQPTATYSGILVDREEKPVAGRMLRLRIAAIQKMEGNRIWFVLPGIANECVASTGPTGEDGKFQFSTIPSGVPFQLIAEGKPPGPEFDSPHETLVFLPGEARANVVFRTDRVGPVRASAPPPIPLAINAAKICRSAALSHMRGLAVLAGDDSPAVDELAHKIVDFQHFDVVLHYLPLSLKAEQIGTEAKTLAHLAWPLPAAGEVVLVVLDGEKQVIAERRLAATEPATALEAAAKFLTEHKLPTRDARQLLAEAKRTAETSGRRLWLIHSGPRCGPCFRLARWIDDHHDLLDKDFVIVKLMDGLDDNTNALFKTYRTGAWGGVPWYVISEPDGKVLTTSDGPTGNIGMPDSIEGTRHFREMLERSVRHLTPAEVTELVDSLGPKK